MKVVAAILISFYLPVVGLAQPVTTEILSPNLYVATDGSDANPGTIDKPFATLARARDAVREFKRGVPKPITVLVRGGDYYLSESLVFGPRDSGTDLQPITYAAYPGEKPTLSGGAKLNVAWKPYRDGILQCSVPAGMDFDQLFINSSRQVRARYPNFDYDNPLVAGASYINSTGGRGKQFGYDSSTFTKKTWAKPTEAIVHIFPGHYWTNVQFWMKRVDRENHVIHVGEGGWQKRNTDADNSFSSDSRFYIENVFEELDAPHEWYLDKPSHTLYYKPPGDMDLKNAVLEVGLLKRIVELKGSRSRPVSHIRLDGFRFAHTATTFLEKYVPPSTGDWGIHRGGAVHFEGAEDCAVENSFFDGVSGNAVFINKHNRRIKVSGNTFTEVGESAVCIVGASNLDMTTPMICGMCGASGRWSFGPDPEDFPSQCVVSNNHMHNLGVYGKQVAGVFMAMTLKNTVSHNYMHHLPRSAICINDPFWGGHLIEFNDIHHTVLETSDHGPLNSWGRGRVWCARHAHGLSDPQRVAHEPGDVMATVKFTTVIRNNRFNDRRRWGVGEWGNYGIDMDDGSANFHVYNNLCIGVGVQNRDGSHRLVENNIIINPNDSVSYHVGHVDNQDRFLRNIVVVSDKYENFDDHHSRMYQMLYPPDEGPWVTQLDYNLLYCDTGRMAATKDLSMDQWREHGLDTHSVIADPMFVDPANGDYRVKPGSPALKLGFKNFPMDQFGLKKDFPKKWVTEESW